MPKNPHVRGLIIFVISMCTGIFLLGAIYLPIIVGRVGVKAPPTASSETSSRHKPAAKPGTMLVAVEESARSADIFLLIRIDVITDRITLTSLPPEMQASRGKRTDTLEAFYRQAGIRETMGAVESLFDIEIDRYMVIDSGVWVDNINRIGTVEATLPSDLYYRDRETGYTISLGAGLGRLDGGQLLSLFRYNRLTGQGTAGHQLEAELFASWINQNFTEDLLARLDTLFTTLVNEVDTTLSMPDYVGGKELLQYFASLGSPAVALPVTGEYASGFETFYIAQESMEAIQASYR